MAELYSFEFNGENYGLTAEGLKIMRGPECTLYYRSILQSVFGDDLNFDVTPRLSQLADRMGESLSKLFELVSGGYHAFDPDQATGERFAKLCKLVGVYKYDKQKTIIDTAVLTGRIGAVVQAGSIAEHQTSGAQFRLLYDVQIETGGSAAVFEALDYGPVECLATKLTKIITPVDGWETVTNTADAKKGRNEEIDSELAQRREDTIKAGGSGRVTAIEQAGKNLENVEICKAYENDKSVVNERGQQANSMEVFFVGGNPQDIGQTLWDNKPGGIPYVGNTSVDIVDSQGVTRTIPYSIPVDVPIWYIIRLTTTGDYPVNGDTQVLNGLLAKANLLGLNQDVVGDPYLKGGYSDVPGITWTEILMGKAENPTLTDNIDIGDTERALSDSSRIQVVHV